MGQLWRQHILGMTKSVTEEHEYGERIVDSG